MEPTTMRSIIALTLLAASAPALAEEVVRAEGRRRAERREGKPTASATTRRSPTISRDGEGVLKATGAGETICSIAPVYSPGVRRIFKVVVRPREAKPSR